MGCTKTRWVMLQTLVYLRAVQLQRNNLPRSLDATNCMDCLVFIVAKARHIIWFHQIATSGLFWKPPQMKQFQGFHLHPQIQLFLWATTRLSWCQCSRSYGVHCPLCSLSLLCRPGHFDLNGSGDECASFTRTLTVWDEGEGMAVFLVLSVFAQTRM